VTKFNSLLELGNFNIAAEIRQEAAELKKGETVYKLSKSAKLVIKPDNATLYDGIRSVTIVSNGEHASHDFTAMQQAWLSRRTKQQ
jgi:uncharacterized cupredoxin-like copper-binding protein